MTTKKWELKDIIMMAILGVILAVSVAVSGGLVLSPYCATEFQFFLKIYGVWFMAATLAAYIIRKPGVALVTEVLASADRASDGQFRRCNRSSDRNDSGCGRRACFRCIPL